MTSAQDVLAESQFRHLKGGKAGPASTGTLGTYPEDARFEFSFRPWAGEPWSLPPLAVRLRGSKTRSLFGLVARPLAELPKLGVAQLCPAPILTNPQALLLCLKL